jgi:hypothetical protein
MAACSYCGTTILFGGKRDGDLRFCNDACHRNGYVAVAAQQMPDHLISQHIWDVHQGLCPKCGGAGPVDVHMSHRVWSALALTSWSSRPHVVCKSCGTKAQIADAFFCLALGWWGFPWGLLVTPVQIVRNIAGMFSGDPTAPSPQLERVVRLHIASQALLSGGQGQ